MFLGYPVRPNCRGVVALVAMAFALGVASGATVLAPAGVRALAPAADEPAAAPPEPVRSAWAVGIARYEAEVVRIVDGDTFEARVHVWPGLEVTTKVRLRGIDAPELRARCPRELARAEAARDALAEMLREGEVAVTRVSLDKYGGRVLADASTRRTVNVSAAMIASGLARPYSGGRRETWCSAE